MVKQSPSRNYRSKGFKVKHVLQICVLLAICFWLIYQVKHSHDKKREFEEEDSVKTHVPDEVLKFGRKDLQPRLHEQTLRNDKVDEDVDEEETGAEEVNNNEEEEQEEDNKNYEKEDEAKGGDDEGDEGDEGKPETEVELEDFFVDGEKEREGGEKEAEEIDLEDMERGQKGNMSSSQEHEQDGGSSISRNSHEAREENYRADDASSAVTHETEPETGMFNSNENTGRKVEEEASVKSNTTTGIKSEKGEMGENGISTNAIMKEDRGSDSSEISSEKLEGASHSNSTVTADSSNLLEVSDNSTNGSFKTNTLLFQNRTVMKPGVTEAQNATIPLVKGNEYDTASNNDQSNSNMANSGNTGNVDAAVTGEFANSSMSAASETALSEKVVASNSSVEVEGRSGISKMEENAETTQNKSETSNGTNKSQDSSESQNAGAVQLDPIDSTDSSVTLDKKDVTLPETRAEGTKNGDAAAQ